jgi:hypothetical protein
MIHNLKQVVFYNVLSYRILYKAFMRQGCEGVYTFKMLLDLFHPFRHDTRINHSRKLFSTVPV